ncbi:MAG: hypothetical protein ACFB15_29260 [Cyclobacteriaceae bacterium]
MNTALVAEVIAFEVHVAKLSKIERKLETCEKAEDQFKTDLASEALKYFTFGIGEDEEFTKKLENDYGLEVYHMGCIVTPPFKCYNTQVEQELGMLEPTNSPKEKGLQ